MVISKYCTGHEDPGTFSQIIKSHSIGESDYNMFVRLRQGREQYHHSFPSLSKSNNTSIRIKTLLNHQA